MGHYLTNASVMPRFPIPTHPRVRENLVLRWWFGQIGQRRFCLLGIQRITSSAAVRICLIVRSSQWPETRAGEPSVQPMRGTTWCVRHGPSCICSLLTKRIRNPAWLHPETEIKTEAKQQVILLHIDRATIVTKPVIGNVFFLFFLFFCLRFQLNCIAYSLLARLVR